MDVLKILNSVDFFDFSTSYKKWDQLGIRHGFLLDVPHKNDVHHVHQVHGNLVHTVTANSSPESTLNIKADGIVTGESNVDIGIKTADCLPVLFSSDSMVAATHAGWRGLSKNILSNTISEFTDKGASLSSVRILIGPAISVAKFEVGPEVVEGFKEFSQLIGDKAFFSCLTKGVSDRWYIDLQQLAVFECVKNGIPAENIAVMRDCTFLNSYWHSYRRSNKDAGRIFSWVSLKN